MRRIFVAMTTLALISACSDAPPEGYAPQQSTGLRLLGTLRPAGPGAGQPTILASLSLRGGIYPFLGRPSGATRRMAVRSRPSSKCLQVPFDPLIQWERFIDACNKRDCVTAESLGDHPRPPRELPPQRRARGSCEDDRPTRSATRG